MAGLLAYPDVRPSHPPIGGQWQKVGEHHLHGFTVAGTATDFPFK